MYYKNKDIRSVDLYWFAVDRIGRVAVFNSNGSDVVPPRLLQTANSILNLYFVNIAKKRCGSLVRAKHSKDVDYDASNNLHFTNCGLFVYDHGNGGGYRMTGRPKIPVSVNELPDFVRSMISDSSIPVSFADLGEVNDAIVNGGEKRIVPELTESEIQYDRINSNSLWRQFIEAFSLHFEKNDTLNLYDLEDFTEFCPDCYDIRGNYVELDGETSSQTDSVEFWEMNRYSFKQTWTCNICGFSTSKKSEVKPGFMDETKQTQPIKLLEIIQRMFSPRML